MSELNAFEAFSMQEFISAYNAAIFLHRGPRYVKVSTTWTSPSPQWSASTVASSVCPREANVLVFAVLTVRPIEVQV